MKQNKRLKTMVLTLCALVILFIGYKVAASMNAQRQRELAAEEAARTATPMIADFDYKKAVAISYQKKGGDFVSIAVEDAATKRWIYTEDPTYPINQTTATYMAYALASMGAQSVVNLEEADPSIFGFEDPAWTFSITYKDANGNITEHTYLQGNYNEFGKASYFKEEGIDDKVYLIIPGLTDYFEYSLHDLADAGKFPIITAEKFDSVDLTVGGEVTHLEGEEITTSFVDLLNILQPSSFIDHHVNNETKAKYGLTEPWMTLTVNYTETITVTDTEGASSTSTIEQKQTFNLQIGDEVTYDGKQYNAYLADGYTFIYLMPKSMTDTLMTYAAAAAAE